MPNKIRQTGKPPAAYKTRPMDAARRQQMNLAQTVFKRIQDVTLPQELTFFQRTTLREDRFNHLRKYIAENITTFADKFRQYLIDVLFFIPFMESRDMMVEKEVGEKIKIPTRVRVPIKSFAELSANERYIAFPEFLAEFELPRATLIRFMNLLLHELMLPDVRYVDNKEIQLMVETVRRGKYRLALELIPEITDEESMTLFGKAIEDIQHELDNPHISSEALAAMRARAGIPPK